MKARIHQNVWDNWYGYLGNQRVMSFTNTPYETAEDQAKHWLKCNNVEKPSPIQLKVLERMFNADGRVKRIPGGFWISGEVEMEDRSGYQAPKRNIDQDLNDIWCDVRTIRALEKRGWVRRTNTHLEEWRDEREITALGIASLLV